MSSAAGKNRLEMFLALNAEAFKRGLADAGQGLSTMSNQAGISFTQTKNALGENVDTVRRYNTELSNQGGILQTLGGHVGALVGAMAASFSVLAGMQKLVDVTREFDKINAGLITATGSIEKSKVAFAVIQDFAAKTPYDLAQVSEGFIKLVNFGLNPSERALKSYGNASSALGKDLNQMIEAVADAATGEFERLKEFGIKSKVEGDNVSFTFRGITETVGKNAKEIEEYLIKLGEVNFGDAMANRMATLDGAMSNLGDAWDKLFLTISNSGIGEAIADGVAAVTKGLEELSAMVASGQLLANLKAMAGQWSAWGDDVAFSIKYVADFFSQTFGGTSGAVQTDWTGLVDFLVSSFKQFPENVRALVGLATVYVASEFDKMEAKARLLKDSVKAIFTDDTIDAAGDRYKQQVEDINQARDESLAAIEKERTASLDSYAKQTAAAQKLREEYDKTKEAGKASKSDRLEQFKAADDSDIDAQVAQKEYQQKQKDIAKKRENATAESLAESESKWKKLEAERELTKEELKLRSDEKKLARELEEKEKEKTTPEKKAIVDADIEEEKDVDGRGKASKSMAEREAKFDRLDDKFGSSSDLDDFDVYDSSSRSRSRRDRDDGPSSSTSSGAISAHGGALTKEEWNGLEKEQQEYLTKIASAPRSFYDYFSNKSGERFKGEVDPTAGLANAARIMVKQNRTQAEQKSWLEATVNAGLQAAAARATGIFGDLSGRVRGQLAAVEPSSGSKDSKTGSVAKIHELRFKGGRLQGSESDIENLLDQLAQAGMSAG